MINLTDSEETKRFKAKQLRYKKPIVKNLNLDFIQQDLWDIQEACEEVHWYTERRHEERVRQDNQSLRESGTGT